MVWNLCYHEENYENTNSISVGDFFDPVVDPAFDCNPSWIAIQKISIPILKKRSRSAFFRLRSAIQIATRIVSFFKKYPLLTFSSNLHSIFLILILHKRLTVVNPKILKENLYWCLFLLRSIWEIVLSY